MPRNSRVDDAELENDQLKDMLGEDQVDNNQSQDNDDDNEQPNQQGNDRQSPKDTGEEDERRESAQKDEQRGQRDREGSRGDRQREQDNSRDKRQQGVKQTQQQTGAIHPELAKLEPKVRQAVLDTAINFVRQRTQPVFNKLEMDNRKLNEQLKIHVAAAQAATEFKLNPAERLMGYRLVAAYKKDAVATIKHLITEAKKKGVNLDGLAGDSSLDMGAIRGMVEELIAPLRGDVEERTRAREAESASVEELTTFFGQNPTAQIHEPVLAAILQRYPEETLQTAWLKVQLLAAKRGWDLNKPINQQQQPQRRDQSNGRPMTMRGARHIQQDDDNSEEKIVYAKPSDKWDTIVRGELRRYGVEV